MRFNGRSPSNQLDIMGLMAMGSTGVLSSSFPETCWFQQQNIHAGILDGIFIWYHGIIMVRREMMRHGRKDNARMIQAMVFPPTSCEQLPSRQPNIFDRTMELRFRDRSPIVVRCLSANGSAGSRSPTGRTAEPTEVMCGRHHKGAERSRRGAAAHADAETNWNGMGFHWNYPEHGDFMVI